MRCRCGNEITHVPEHLRDLASWVCKQCTNVAPRASATTVAKEQKENAEKKKAA
ncbi:MAG: hypothetical protein ACYC64_05100 [Armatimonadota bacterium]